DPLVGRTNELKAIETYLTSPHVRLVTIVGPGGMGKTRLARACGEGQLSHPERFPDGAFFVPLASLSEERQIYPAIAGAVGFTLEAAGQASRPPAQQVLDYLCQKQLLLILDN